jgi:O-antigen/teichoic acid export membrane protein
MGGKSSANLIISAGSVILNVALNLLLIPHIGLAGGAIALAASILHSNFWNSLLIWRSFRIQPFARGYLVVAGSAVVLYGLIGLAVRATFGTGFAVVAIFSIVATIPYAAAIYAKRDLLDLHAFQALMGRRFSGRTA